MALIVVGILFYINYNGYEIEKSILIFSGVFILGIIILVEILQAREWWGVTEHSLVHSKSILNKSIREIDFSSISDLDLDKPFYKRILNYGTVNVRLFINETAICIKNINRPEEFIDFLQELISKRGGTKNVLGKN